MPEITTFLPNYDIDPEYNANLLRQSIPLMTKNHVSTHPINYAIWYEYVSGNNGQLNDAVDKLIHDHIQFDEKISLKLYKDHICHASIESFEKINGNLQSLIDNTSETADETSASISTAGDNFLASSAQLENISDINEVKSVLSEIVSETKNLAEISSSLKSKLNEANDEMKELRNELIKVKKMATIDALTGLLNRRAFDDEISNLVNLTSQKTSCFLILDLDHFKKVNDTFGHLVGDKVIRYTAGLLKKHSLDSHHIARYGGEELAVIMPETTIEDALKIAESIRMNLSTSQLKQKDNGLSIGKITVSIGATVLLENDTAESLIARADKALYIAKDTGRNQVVQQLS